MVASYIPHVNTPRHNRFPPPSNGLSHRHYSLLIVYVQIFKLDVRLLRLLRGVASEYPDRLPNKPGEPVTTAGLCPASVAASAGPTRWPAPVATGRWPRVRSCA